MYSMFYAWVLVTLLHIVGLSAYGKLGSQLPLMGQTGAIDRLAGHISSHILKVLIRPLRPN